MRFMIMFKADAGTEASAPACMAMPEMGKFIEELKNDGVLIATEGLKPSSSGARLRYSGGKVSVTDGPFAEAKELVAGFVLVEVASRQAAVELGERFLRVAGDGTAAEVREVFDAPHDAAHVTERQAPPPAQGA
ncbi:YciI family protein [Sorangium sp. So ce1335]|uniref:YciI family protein n=1 Tax=Sorangium sp. So ce1335 TaxID=3133335 RepID=UPI003F616CE2